MIQSQLFTKICKRVTILNCRKGKEIYKKGEPLINVYYLIKGKLMFANEVNLNLASTFYNGIINRKSAFSLFFTPGATKIFKNN